MVKLFAGRIVPGPQHGRVWVVHDEDTQIQGIYIPWLIGEKREAQMEMTQYQLI